MSRSSIHRDAYSADELTHDALGGSDRVREVDGAVAPSHPPPVGRWLPPRYAHFVAGGGWQRPSLRGRWRIHPNTHFAIVQGWHTPYNPVDIVLIFECRPGSGEYGGKELLDPRHSGGCNALFPDLHIEGVCLHVIDGLRWTKDEPPRK
jgi:prepilin-type processing-associated H-X9-DG protein